MRQLDRVDTEVLSVEQAGSILGLGRTAAYDMVKRGELPVLRVGRRILIPVRALEKLLENGAESHHDSP
jgi:excisionase family DNA binding protein